MLPAFWLQHLCSADLIADLINDNDLVAGGDLPNPRNLDSGNAGRNLFSAARGEKQFVILPSMQGKLQIDFPQWLPDPRAWDSLLLDFRPHPAFFAQMRKVGGEAVARVGHG